MFKFYLRERTGLGIHQWNKISSKSLKGPAGIALPRRLCILISSYYYYYYYKITTEQDSPRFAIEEWNRDRTSSSRDVRSNPITSLAKRSWFFSRKPRASYSTYNQPLQQTELHCVPKKGSHLMFDNNFGKCGPIFKILLPTDSSEKSLCTHHRDFHHTWNMLLHYLVKVGNPNLFWDTVYISIYKQLYHSITFHGRGPYPKCTTSELPLTQMHPNRISPNVNMTVA